MKIEVLYNEVEKILEEKINKEISLEYLGDNKIRVSILGCDFDLEVVKIDRSKIRLEYETGLIGKGLISALASMTPGIDKVCYQTLEIDLSEIDDFFNNIQLNYINFTDNSIKIEGCLEK